MVRLVNLRGVEGKTTENEGSGGPISGGKKDPGTLGIEMMERDVSLVFWRRG